MTSTNSAPEKGTGLEVQSIQPILIVSQPQKLESLLETLAIIDRVSERVGEDRSGDMGGGGGTQQTATGSQQTQQSLRQLAIANLPVEQQMKKKVAQHIDVEVRKLQREVHKLAREASKPGVAFRINKLYARIRRLRGLLHELAHSSFDVLKRIYIRIFVDGQSVL